ncbi:MAG: hypothetical protein NTX21_05080 [Alphaproteobacteria bacterium]|nr:hypothetical protein [Alphaproteobacteria bacterium]
MRYRLNFTAKCYEIDRQFGLRFKDYGVGRLSCDAKGVSVLLRNAGSERECFIRDIEYQTLFLDRSDLAALGTGRLGR